MLKGQEKIHESISSIIASTFANIFVKKAISKMEKYAEDNPEVRADMNNLKSSNDTALNALEDFMKKHPDVPIDQAFLDSVK